MVDFAPMASTQGESEQPLQRREVAVFIVRVLAILTACWAVVGLLLAPALPGGGGTAVLAWALLTLLPLGVFIGTRLRGAYAGAIVRLLVFRPLWYAQFFVLLLAPVGAVAALAGLPFGRASEAGRVAVVVAGVFVALVALAGYAGSRRLEVRRLVAAFPVSPPGSRVS